MAICIREGNLLLLSLPSQMFISSKTTLIDTPGIMFDQISGPPVAQIGWHKINHHRYHQLYSWLFPKFYVYPEARKQVKHSPAWLQLDHKCDRKTFHQLPLQICMCSAINKYLEHIQIRYKLTCIWTPIKTQNYRTIGFQNWQRPQNSLDECTHSSHKHKNTRNAWYIDRNTDARAWIRDREFIYAGPWCTRFCSSPPFTLQSIQFHLVTNPDFFSLLLLNLSGQFYPVADPTISHS